MKTFPEIKRNCKKNTDGMPEYRLAVLGNCATQHLSQAIKGYAYDCNIAVNVFDADYNQILAQVMDPSSELYEHKANAVLIDMCTEKLYDAYREKAVSERDSFSDEIINEIKGYWDRLTENGLKIMQFNFPEIDDRVLGNFCSSRNDSFITQLRKLNIMLSEEAAKRGNVYIVDIAYIQNMLGRKNFSDSKLYYSAKMPYSLESLVYIGKEVTEIISVLMGKLRKCIVLDLDNTLWGGVVGDDGVNGIQIGELGVGHAFSAFQEWLLELKKTGIILCVCSKNDDDKAKEPFLKHPEMVLKLDDFAMFTANWQDKASNIIEMAKTLNLNTDSFVFVDDNPFERDQVREMVPGITVPDMPEDPAEYVNYLKSLNLFERVTVSSADQDRTRQYQEEAGRKSLESKFATYDDYLKALEMVAEVKTFDEYSLPRIAQLSQRSNQFNLRTVRYTEDDVRRLSESDDYITLDFSLKDKFGDHGLISVMVVRKCKSKEELKKLVAISGDADGVLTESIPADDNAAGDASSLLGAGDASSLLAADDAAGFIENWFMSCRVLKRGMEEFIMNTLNEKAKEAGLKIVVGEYLKTPKNNMVSKIYKNMGFDEIGENIFAMDVEKYQKRTTYIEL